MKKENRKLMKNLQVKHYLGNPRTRWSFWEKNAGTFLLGNTYPGTGSWEIDLFHQKLKIISAKIPGIFKTFLKQNPRDFSQRVCPKRSSQREYEKSSRETKANYIQKSPTLIYGLLGLIFFFFLTRILTCEHKMLFFYWCEILIQHLPFTIKTKY